MNWRLLVPAAYMAALLSLSSIPGNLEPDSSNVVGAVFMWVTPAWQNLLHVPLYAGLAISWMWALGKGLSGDGWRLAAAFALTCVWGMVDESYQLTVPGRYGSFTDMGLNVLGAALAVIFVRCYFISRLSNPLSHTRD